ncbi:MAG: hypothetical protein UV73_C0005G0022 [Candidatus Gottesmanbacteria bacterium GW2011_GWA2_43_14]|uniref:Uncharacterized protein n=1 Tax=Candidatus Gottesmanbacteria bacterium GW2011_GWA2_43_14 TaxID=1618443 RepID=A0A0G1DIS7_9BACT|nr:MAG: hypothetical protein UV73_C0005G0022 [Candidatus Gottesmanbacteria bacterium GW2011_GWA2_43_14]
MENLTNQDPGLQVQPTKIEFAKDLILSNLFPLILSLLWLAFLISVIVFLVMKFTGTKKRAANFEECAGISGSRIMESYPEKCVTPDGLSFTRELTADEKNRLIPPWEVNVTKAVPAGNCRVSGCNGEICQPEKEEPLNSICIYREEFECYKNAECVLQEDGSCGWTKTEELTACLGGNL